MNKNSTITLDNKHNEKMNNFEKINTKIIPLLKKEKKMLKKNLKNETDLEKKLEMGDKLMDIKKKINKLKTKKMDYLLENSELIFDYFEKKKESIDGNNKSTVLHSFFQKKEDKVFKERKNKNNIYKYLVNINEYNLDINNYVTNYDRCKSCNIGEMIHVENKGLVICNNCGIQTSFIIQQEKPSYKEPPKEVCFYAYKRINHFREILAQFQAKETTQIPKEVIKNIKLQIKKERVQLKNLTNNKAKDILKKLGYNKYYEHIPFIKDKLGIRPPIMTPELENKLCNLFMDIQKPYSKHCPDDRVNFLNYYYVLYKMCELLGKTEFLPFFPMLKDPIKRIEQDEIWKKICNELNWEFIVTV
jgi:hypothetical protein